MLQRLLSLLLALAITSSVFSQSLWTEVNETPSLRTSGKRVVTPDAYKVFKLNVNQLKSILNTAPPEFTEVSRSGTNNILEIPTSKGTIERFRIAKSSIMEQGLQNKYPEIVTFSGQGIDDPAATIRIDYNPYTGFHAMVYSPNGDYAIDPYIQGNTDNYVTYYKRDLRNDEPYLEKEIRKHATSFTNGRVAAAPCRGTQLYTYRLAVACTGEYAVAATGSANPTKAQTQAAITTSINRVTGIYEKEVAVRLILVANNDTLVYTNGATDPFQGNANPSTLIDESQWIIDSLIGPANYDVGHTFSTGAGGLAALGVICQNGVKAQGVTGRDNPVGDPYDVDYVAHELGHQFGGNHTFNGADPTNCGGINQNMGTAYEVGSGTTIQAYAGICLADDIQPNSDAYFHAISYDEIVNHVMSGSGNNCKQVINTGNNPPTISALPNNGKTIPIQTPFTLTGSASDPNGDALTYCWEQWDAGPTPIPWNGGTASALHPIFRSRNPKTTGSRTFPDMRVIVANYPVNPPSQMDGLKGEVLSSVPRTMKFRFTARDNRAGGGGVASAGEGCHLVNAYSIIVGAAGPFSVLAPNGGETITGGSNQTVTWNSTLMNNSTYATEVNILLSVDGGFTYPYTLVSNTPNDGSQSVTIPNLNPSVTTARIKIEAVGNIFFDISNADFTINNNPILPITLSSFTLQPLQKNNALLNWRTASESNNKGFEIQRSIGNNTAFKTVTFENSKGNTTTGNSYSFTDRDLPFNTNIYYRLKQVNNDGSFSYSEVRTIRFNQKGIYISIAPNPTKDEFVIKNDGATVENVQMSITDMLGRQVLSRTVGMNTGTARVNVSHLNAGTYIVKLNVGDEMITQKLIKE